MGPSGDGRAGGRADGHLSRTGWPTRWSAIATDAATLEVTLIGPELTVDRPVWAAVAGADVRDHRERRARRRRLAVRRFPAGGRLRFGAAPGRRPRVCLRSPAAWRRRRCSAAGRRIWSAGWAGSKAARCRPGIECRSAHPASAPPRAASPNARLRVSPPSGRSPPARDCSARRTPGSRRRPSTRSPTAPSASRRARTAWRFTLEGPPLPVARDGEPLSEPVPFGAIQVPAGGAPLLLMADRQTAGGYSKIATVICADLPVAGQLAPGDLVVLRRVHAGRSAGRAHRARARADAASGGSGTGRECVRSTRWPRRCPACAIAADAPLAPLTTFKVGGPADGSSQPSDGAHGGGGAARRPRARRAGHHPRRRLERARRRPRRAPAWSFVRAAVGSTWSAATWSAPTRR